MSLGLSTAGSEASFFGTKSFHYDVTGTEHLNEFSINGFNKVVFNQIDNLSLALEKEINFQSKSSSVEENKKFHSILDHYQDGRCGERTAIIIDSMFKNFNGLHNLHKTLTSVEDEIKNNSDLFKKKY